jgi:hypothetical protein
VHEPSGRQSVSRRRLGDTPLIAVAWQYTGLDPQEMEGRITTVFERVLTTLVDNIEHIGTTSTSYCGVWTPACSRSERWAAAGTLSFSQSCDGNVICRIPWR